ncbi:MAG: sulfotransferase family protein [Candidatus Thorarchaeota archaeon]|jgi:hypothetical protein
MIFVGGYPRTGTTLVHALLCGDRRANDFVGECTYLEFLLQAYSAISQYPGDHAFTDYWKDIPQFTEYIKKHIDELFTMFKEIHQCEIMVLKRPQMTAHLPILAEMYPEAKFVVTVRDPLDVAASLKKVKRRYALEDGKQADPFISQSVFDMMAAYSATMLMLTERSSAFHENRLMYIKYEGLVNYTSSTVSKLREFSGLDCKLGWEDVDFDKNRAFYSPLWCKPIESSRVGRWKKILSKEEVELTQAAGLYVQQRFAYRMEGADEERVREKIVFPNADGASFG